MNHDLIIRDGTVVDGTGADPFQADVAITGDEIVEIGTPLSLAAGILIRNADQNQGS